MNDCTMSSSDSHDLESTVLPPPHVDSSVPDHQNVTEDVLLPPPAPFADSPGGTSKISPKSVPVTDVLFPHLPESSASTPVARNLNTGDPDIQVNSPHLVDVLPGHEMSPLNNPLTSTKLTTNLIAAGVSSHLEDFNSTESEIAYQDLSFPKQISDQEIFSPTDDCLTLSADQSNSQRGRSNSINCSFSEPIPGEAYMTTSQSKISEKNFYNKNSEEVRGGGGGVKAELQVALTDQVPSDDDPVFPLHPHSEGPRHTGDTKDWQECYIALKEKNTALEDKNTALDEKNTALEEKNTALEEKNTALEVKITALEKKITDLNEELKQVKQENTEIKNEASEKNTALEEKITDLNEELEQVKQENTEIKNEASEIKKHVLHKIMIEDDGNCLFRAVARLHPPYKEENHDILRRQAYEWLKANKDTIKISDKHLRDIGRPDTMVTYHAFQALACILKCKFKVYASVTVSPTGPVDRTINLSYDRLRNHIDALVENAPVDDTS